MTARTLGMLARVVGGELVGDDTRFDGVSTDTRSIEPGQLFVAIHGPRFDGHDFVEAARAGGAAGALVSRRLAVMLPQVAVKDTRVALGAYAKAWRLQFGYPVVGLTGSNGKTTTKEMIAGILRGRGPVLATAGNLNNDIGVPLTLLGMESTHHAAVIEMGANHAGEIAQLTGMAVPTVALVTNAGPAHLEGFGSIEGVARAKGEIYEHLAADATAVVNLDDEWSGLWRELAGSRTVVGFGFDADAPFSVDSSSIDTLADGRQSFVLRSPAGVHQVTIPVPGLHNVRNALAAIATAVTAGAGVADAVAALASYRPVGGRLVPIPAQGGGLILDDTYNANPASLDAALQVLATHPGPRWLVLGDMGELGGAAEAAHTEAGAAARRYGVEALFGIGPLTRHAVAAFGDGAEHFTDVDALCAALREGVPAGTTALIKGSRGMRMERVADALRAEGGS